MTSYRETVRTLQPALTPIFDALQKGLDAAAEEHTTRRFRRKDDPWFYAHLARRVACEELVGNGLQAVNEDTGRPLNPLSGLLVPYRGVALKILRPSLSRRGEMIYPIPGRSTKRQQFWRQDPALEGMETDNLLLLWQDKDGKLVEPMKLLRPLGGNHRRNSLILNWEGKLSRAMANMRAEDLDLLVADAEYPDLGTGKTG